MRGATGSASQPSYAFYGDHDTGMYRGSGVNILSFATAGTERLNLNADGVATFSSATGIHTGVKIQQTALNNNAGLEINATNGGQARLNLKTSKSGTNRAARIDFYNQNAQKWTLINDYDQNGTNDLSIRYGIDGGSWGEYLTMNPNSSVELFHSGTVKLTTQSSGVFISGALRLQGTESAYRTGQAQPLIYRSGSTSGSYPFNAFGHLIIQTRIDGSNRDIIFATGTSSANQIVINSNGDMKIPDGKELQFGGPLNSGDGDLRLHHNATDSYISNVTGHLRIGNTNDNKNIKFFTDGSTKWNIDPDGHFIPDTAGAVNIGSATAEIGNVYIADDKKFYAGSDQNISLYHTSSNGINHLVAHPGNFMYHSGTHYFTNAAQSQVYAQFIQNSYCELRHAGNLKFRTSETGIDVTGEVAATQDYPNFRPTVDFNFAAEKKLDPSFTYQRTGAASFVNEFGKIVLVGDNIPRFDHDIVTRESKGLLIEEARTNLALYSDMDMDSIGSGYYGNVNLARAEGPDGVSNSALQVTFTASGSSFVRSGLIPCSAGVEYTFSVWIKKVSGSFNNSFFSYPQNAAAGLFNNSGFVNTEGQSLSAMPTGVWKRFTQTRTTASGTTAMDFVMPGYDSNGAVIQYYGLQMEAGGFATSYIPSTDGSSTSRGMENVTITDDEFTDFYNPIESTVVCEFDTSNWITYNNNKYERIFAFGNHNTETDTFEVFKENSSNSEVRYRVRTGNSNVLGAANYSYGTNTTPKVAFAVKLNDAAVTVDGGTPGGTSDTGIPMPTVTKLSLGNSGLENNGGAHTFNGYIRKFMYYPVKLPDSQVVTLTS